MQLKKWQITVTLVCLISGFLISLQLQVQSNMADTELNEKDELVAMIKELEEETFSMEDRIDTLRQSIKSFQEDLTTGQYALESLQSELSILRTDLGLTEVTGSGVVITIDDNVSGAESARAEGLDRYHPDDYIIHYKNLLYFINEIRNTTDAISINNHRVVASTDIRCVGTVILVNTTRLAPPYEIKLIGNPRQLEYAINNSSELNYLTNRGFPTEINLQDELTINAYRGSYRYNYAEIFEEADA
ncbi:uncharacterized protein YlxW (UPF0749 family) [Desulfitispora alkaliphila]|uniref:DUF881 domain-containing protein n=1 Tax=Desulfitispora alkaliphila TaxID=622674 RepID=UPI003D218150